MLVEMRRRIFRSLADTGLPPELTRAEIAELAAAHAVVLDDAGRIAFANPFAVGPSNCRVLTHAGTYDAACIWDALGIAALFGPTAHIETRCPDCSASLRLDVRDGELVPTGYAVHFLVPAAQWYDNFAFT